MTGKNEGSMGMKINWKARMKNLAFWLPIITPRVDKREVM